VFGLLTEPVGLLLLSADMVETLLQRGDFAEPVHASGFIESLTSVRFDLQQTRKLLQVKAKHRAANAGVRCPLLRIDPAQLPRLEEIHANLADRPAEAREQGWMGEVAAIETTMAAAARKLEAMRIARSASVHLGIPEVRNSTGRASTAT
jgi:hypothetical protein